MAARGNRAVPDSTPDTSGERHSHGEGMPCEGATEIVVLGNGEALLTAPVYAHARSFLAWFLSRRDAARGQLAVDWPELAF